MKVLGFSKGVSSSLQGSVLNHCYIREDMGGKGKG